MLRYGSVFFISLFVWGETFSQSKNARRTARSLEWNEFYELTWSDFEGTRTSDAIGDAATVVRIEAKPFRTGSKIQYRVTALFIRSKSWVSDPSQSLLKHERLHFDLAELYARKIRKRVDELNRQNVKSIKVYNAAVQELLDESNIEDRRYDIETLHGAMVKKQAAWENSIREELDLLDDYRNQKRVISKRR
jgi:hypothetical protein